MNTKICSWQDPYETYIMVAVREIKYLLFAFFSQKIVTVPKGPGTVTKLLAI